MKALRYLLIAVVMMLTAMPAGAQEYTNINSVAGCTTFGQTERQYKFHSTSAILMADTQLGLAEGGAFTAGVNTGNPVKVSGPRRVGEDDGFEDEGDDPGNLPGEPFPIGDGMWVLLLMAAGYLIYRVRTRKRVAMA